MYNVPVYCMYMYNNYAYSHTCTYTLYCTCTCTVHVDVNVHFACAWHVHVHQFSVTSSSSFSSVAFRTIYEKLGGAVPEEQRALYSQRVDEMVPSIRYCAYNIGDLPSDLSQLMKLRTSAPGSDILSSNIDVSQWKLL